MMDMFRRDNTKQRQRQSNLRLCPMWMSVYDWLEVMYEEIWLDVSVPWALVYGFTVP